MSDRILNKYTGRTPDTTNGEAASAEPDGTEDLGSFGWLRGVRDRCIMLELRKKSGTVLAIGYGWIERIEFDPSGGIRLQAGGQVIRIKGRNLNAEARPQVRLFQGLTRHRVPWIQEADRASDLRSDHKSVVVEAIEW